MEVGVRGRGQGGCSDMGICDHVLGCVFPCRLKGQAGRHPQAKFFQGGLCVILCSFPLEAELGVPESAWGHLVREYLYVRGVHR